jgi:hypothetical protein
MKRVYVGRPADVDGDGNEIEGTELAPVLPIPEPWPLLPGLNAVLVDRKTGNLASRWCDEEDQYVEYYVPGTEPTEPCDRSGGRRFRIPRLR